MTAFILSIIAILVFFAYEFFIMGYFGIPCSLSQSYYLLEGKKKHAGIAFTAMMWICSLLLLPGWLELASTGDWREGFTFLAFLCPAAIAMTGSAPQFRLKNSMEPVVHYACAGLAGFSGLLWTILYNATPEQWWIIPTSLGLGLAIPFTVAGIKKNLKKTRDWTLEQAAFITVFCSLIINYILGL